MSNGIADRVEEVFDNIVKEPENEEHYSDLNDLFEEGELGSDHIDHVIDQVKEEKDKGMSKALHELGKQGAFEEDHVKDIVDHIAEGNSSKEFSGALVHHLRNTGQELGEENYRKIIENIEGEEHEGYIPFFHADNIDFKGSGEVGEEEARRHNAEKVEDYGNPIAKRLEEDFGGESAEDVRKRFEASRWKVGTNLVKTLGAGESEEFKERLSDQLGVEWEGGEEKEEYKGVIDEVSDLEEGEELPEELRLGI